MFASQKRGEGEKGEKNLVEILLSAGADVNLLNKVCNIYDYAYVKNIPPPAFYGILMARGGGFFTYA